jgi:hypothetical protein
MPFFVATVLSGLGALALAAHGLWKRPATISKVDQIGMDVGPSKVLREETTNES